jgi:hypothetical protein
MAQQVTRFLPDNEPSPEPIPPLEPGDRLTRPEFERRYDAMPHLRKAELIEGVVHMPSPVRYRHHGRPLCSPDGMVDPLRSGNPRRGDR